jgi:putative hydrolase of the HAD superfamily
MQNFEHYSFDLWLTLIKSNPEFKKRRTDFFFHNFNYFRKPSDEVSSIFRKVDLMCNSINEKTGRNIYSSEMYLMVISIINDYSITLKDIDLDFVSKKMEKLLFEYIPVIYSSETFEVMDFLKQKGKTVSLLSNTGFIPGGILRKVLNQIGIGLYLDFQIYSDEVGMSKPNKQIFDLMVNTAASNTKDKVLKISDIVHVGDNPIADIDGANSCGIKSLLINSNNISITTILA